MGAVEFIYGAFFLMALFCAMMVVLSSHTVHSALYLVLTMAAIAGLFILMNAQLAAVFQLIIYAGAIMVMFMFVIMLLNLGHQERATARTAGLRPLGLVLIGGLGVQVVALFAAHANQIVPSAKSFAGVGINEVARMLITDYVYVFEITSVLLLVGVIGAVMLARRHKAGVLQTKRN